MNDLDAMLRKLAAFLDSVRPGRTATVQRYALMTGGYSRVMAKAEVRWEGRHDRNGGSTRFGNKELGERGSVLLSARSATEVDIMGEWGFVGRG